MLISEQIALAAIYYFGQAFVFCRLINKKVLKCFLLIMCKEHTLSRSTKFRTHSTSRFWLRTEGHQKSIPNHLIGNNCPEFHNGLLDSYFFKLALGSDCLELCFWTVAFETILTQEYYKNTKSLSNQNFKHNSAQLTPKLSFEPGLHKFVINGYYTKSKRL